jgi:hypothetical protein
MEEPVEDRGGDHRVPEHFAPAEEPERVARDIARFVAEL